jgi:hypothetical protein
MKRLKKRVARLRRELEGGSGVFCSHSYGIIVAFLPDGTLKDTPELCAICDKPPKVEMVCQMGENLSVGSPEWPTWRVPTWLIPALEKKENYSLIIGLDPDWI